MFLLLFVQFSESCVKFYWKPCHAIKKTHVDFLDLYIGINIDAALQKIVKTVFPYLHSHLL